MKSMKNVINQLGVNLKKSGVMQDLVLFDTAANKNILETEMPQAFIVNASSEGYQFNAGDDDMPERIFMSFIAATSVYLGKVKKTKEDEAVALVLTDTSGNFKFAGIVKYNENKEKPEEPGNWNYVMTFNEQDVTDLEKKRTVVKHLYSDTAFKTVFDKVSYDIGAIQFQHERYMYVACLILIDTLIQVLDKEAKAGETVDLELAGYCTCSVEVEADEKIFAITPDGAMKALIKSDVDLEK